MRPSRRFALYSMNLLAGLIAGACLASNPLWLAIAIVIVVLQIAVALLFF